MAARKHWLRRHPLLVMMVFYILLWLGLELLVGGAARLGFWNHQRLPTTERSQFWSDLHESFGVWRYPHAKHTLEKPCFRVSYETNSYGARDRERIQGWQPVDKKARRFVVLGDSFVEGFGVEQPERFTEQLEAQTGWEFLNFGVSGSFGPIQEWLLYRDFAKPFAHTDVLIMFLPDNDFNDMREEFHSPRRYRPYLRKRGSQTEWELYYPVSFAERDLGLSSAEVWKHTIINRSYVLSLLHTVFHEQFVTRKDPYADQARYAAFDPQDIEKLLYSYEQIVKEAEGRRVYIASIPRLRDLRWASNGYNKTHTVAPILESFAAKHPGVTYIDLMPTFLAAASKPKGSLEAMFHTCDGHWSPAGHKLAAEVLKGFW